MADKETRKVRSKNMTDMYFLSWRRRFLSNFLRSVRIFLGTLLVVVIVFFLLSGVINQVKTGQTLVDYSLQTGKKIGVFFESLFTSESPFKITEDGIYFKDANVPNESAIDGSKLPDIDDTKENVEEAIKDTTN